MDAVPELGRSILTEPVLVVRQEWADLGEVGYEVLDERRVRLATGRYLPKDAVTSLLRSYGLRPWTAAALEVVDDQERTILTVAFPGMRGRAVMLVQDGEGHPLGTAVKTKGYAKVRYELRHRDKVVGAIQVLDWRERGVRVEDDRGSEVAVIETTKDGYQLAIGRPLKEPLRSLLVASTVALRAAIGDESHPGSSVEDGGGTTVVRTAVLPPIFDRLRRTRAHG